jgi:hypothetical protein
MERAILSKAWMRTAGMGALVALSFGASASAQVDLRGLRQRNEILQQQDTARQNVLSAQREASAAQSRYATQLTLRSLDAAATSPAQPTLRPTLSPTPPRGPGADDLAADLARMDSLTDERLAQSNARLRDVTPAH